MDSRLQKAIGAARMGERRTAQQLLTDILKDDPEQIQAWFLLSHLVESPQKQQAYLGKVLALDPAHEQARQRLALLRSGQTGGAAQGSSVEPVVKVADASLDVVVQAEGDTLPEWMVEDAELVQPETAVTPAEPDALPAPAPEEELPDWLQESVSDDFLGTPPDLVKPTSQPQTHPHPSTSVQSTPPQKTRPQPAAQAAVKRWNLVLMTLIILAVIALILLINAFLSI